jgi:hypothetical protein
MRFSRLVLLLALLSSMAVGAAELLQPRPPVEIPDARGGFGTLVVDDAKRRLLLAHPGNRTLDVLDLNTEKVVKQISLGVVKSVVVDAPANRYHLVAENKCLSVDRERLEPAGEFTLPGAAEVLALGPSSVNRVYAAGAESREVWAVDAAKKSVATAVAVPAGATALLAEDSTIRVYAAVTADDTVQIISAADHNSTLGGAWPVAPAKKPQALALDTRGQRLFVAGVNNKLVTLAANDGPRIGVNDLPGGVTQLAFDSERQRLYAPGGGGKLAVFDTRGNFLRPLGDVTTPRGAKSIALDARTGAVWLAYTKDGKCYAQKFVP